MSPSAPRPGTTAPALVLAAGCATAVLTWLTLTTVPLVSATVVLALTAAVLLAAVLVARRSAGRRRWLAVAGGTLAALPLLVVAVLLSTSDG